MWVAVGVGSGISVGLGVGDGAGVFVGTTTTGSEVGVGSSDWHAKPNQMSSNAELKAAARKGLVGFNGLPD